MEIKTRFNIGDTAYFLNEYNRLVECQVVEMAISISKPYDYVFRDLEYIVKYYDGEDLMAKILKYNVNILSQSELSEAVAASLAAFGTIR